jgi:Xaa-Pro aminopeptidase
MLVTNETNVTYLSGFTGHDSMLLIAPDRNYFITDSRYIQEARDTLKGFSLRLVDISTYDTISDIVEKERLKRIGFESMDLPYGVALKLGKLMKKRKAEIVPCKDVAECMRSVKDPDEIVLIRDSIRITKSVMAKITRDVRPGISEIALSFKIERAFIRERARPAFEPIAASSENASKPHAAPTDTKIENDSFVMIDIGAKLNNYCSDITRMFLLGRVKSRFKNIYDIVTTAQKKAIEKIRPGVKIRDIDTEGRAYIRDKGFGRYFSHSLGHGIGLSVHEQPTISSSSKGTIMPGMVFTIEPAIYIPKFGGARIEDMVLVTDSGCEVLTV